MNPEAKLSVRCRPGNADHHLWNNNGTFWCHLTVHFADYTKQRLRLSLETGDVQHARRLRDSLIALLGGTVTANADARENKDHGRTALDHDPGADRLSDHGTIQPKEILEFGA